jgi:peptide methionine sulfoxide reductase msrA/msrB
LVAIFELGANFAVSLHRKICKKELGGNWEYDFMDRKQMIENMKPSVNQRKTASIILILAVLGLGIATSITEQKPFNLVKDGSNPGQVEQVSVNTSDYSEQIQSLSKQEYYVTQENGTEPAFQNEYYDHKKPGIYVDVVSGAPLFSSKHKYDSGTGWPAFYKPLEPENLITREDPGPLGVRTEVASKDAKTHLGHIFEDGPEDKTGLRYCINSASLEFIPADQLEERGYGEYSSMFDNTTGDNQ